MRERFSSSGWECPKILEALDGVDGLYMDRVSQIRMDRWTQGRVALVGDASCRAISSTASMLAPFPWSLGDEDLPYTDGFFDTVLSTMAFSGYPDARNALAEMLRVLKADGRLVAVAGDEKWRG